MKHTPPTSTTATPRDDAGTPQPSDPTLAEMLEELIDLGAGLSVTLLPLLVLAVPAIVLFVVLPAILLVALAAPLVALGTVIAAPPYLVARWRRRRRRTDTPPAAMPAARCGRSGRAVARGSRISVSGKRGHGLASSRRARSETVAPGPGTRYHRTRAGGAHRSARSSAPRLRTCTSRTE